MSTSMQVAMIFSAIAWVIGLGFVWRALGMPRTTVWPSVVFVLIVALVVVLP